MACEWWWCAGKTQLARLCYILKLLVETERQLRSTSTHEQTSNIIATTFLDITSMKASNINNIVLPARRQLSTSSHNGITLHSAASIYSVFIYFFKHADIIFF